MLKINCVCEILPSALGIWIKLLLYLHEVELGDNWRH